MTGETTAPTLPDGFPLDPRGARVIGALIEKAMTTPDNYPLSLNAVTTACNQVSNRDPVVEFDETDVETALRELADNGIASLYRKPGDRVIKYVHKLDRVLGIGPGECAVLAVLLLRGEQTPGELRQRTQRYGTFESLEDIEQSLSELMEIIPPLVERLPRRPGQKETRYRQLIATSPDTGGADKADGGTDDPTATAEPAQGQEMRQESMRDGGSLADRVAELERRLGALLEVLGVDDL